ncbi:unnamed protein product [Effrenium voratum]|nr:unnamed protein product [Effrenium voratum]
MWVDIVYSIISFVLIFYTSWVYEALISQNLMPADTTQVDLLCAFMFNSQVVVSLGIHPGVHVAWILATLSTCWTTNNPHLQVDIKITHFVGFLMHAFTHYSQMRLRDSRLEWEAELSRIRKREEQQQLERLEAVRRREQMERMVALVFNQVKAPLLLAKSELSRPGDAKDILACAQGRIQQLWSLLSGVQNEMQKEFDVGAGEGKFRARVTETLRGTRKEPGTRSEPAAETGSQSSGSAPSPRLHKTANQRRTFDSKWTESCAALLEASCIQLGVDVHAPWKLRWVRIELDGRQSSCLSSLLTPTDMLHFRRWLEPEINRLTARQAGKEAQQDFAFPYLGSQISAGAYLCIFKDSEMRYHLTAQPLSGSKTH